MSATPLEPLWTLKDLAAFLNVTEGSARKIVSRGQLPSDAVLRIGSRIRIRPAAVRTWIASRPA
jgi:hypothetical protein